MTLMMMVTNFSETKKQGKSKCFRICVWGGGGGRREIRVFLARIFTITTYINNFPFHSHLYSLIVGSKSAEFLFCHGIPEWFFFCQFAFNKLVIFNLTNRFWIKKILTIFIWHQYVKHIFNTIECYTMHLNNSSNLLHIPSDSFIFWTKNFMKLVLFFLSNIRKLRTSRQEVVGQSILRICNSFYASHNLIFCFPVPDHGHFQLQ